MQSAIGRAVPVASAARVAEIIREIVGTAAARVEMLRRPKRLAPARALRAWRRVGEPGRREQLERLLTEITQRLAVLEANLAATQQRHGVPREYRRPSRYP